MFNKGNDIAAIKEATEAVQKAFYAVSEKLYQQAGAGQAGPDMGGGFQGGPDNMGGGFQGGPQGKDNVYDADYEVVDDDNK